jgi:hypothetical protein
MKSLLQKLNQAKKQVIIGKDYVHYKGGLYTVVNVALNENTQEIDVIYRPTSGRYKNLLFSRPLKQWNEPISEILWNDHVRGLEVIRKRFEKV